MHMIPAHVYTVQLNLSEQRRPPNQLLGQICPSFAREINIIERLRVAFTPNPSHGLDGVTSQSTARERSFVNVPHLARGEKPMLDDQIAHAVDAVVCEERNFASVGEKPEVDDGEEVWGRPGDFVKVKVYAPFV